MPSSEASAPLFSAKDPLESFDSVKMLSPSEMDFAFVAAAHRDKDDNEKAEEWRTRLKCL